MANSTFRIQVTTQESAQTVKDNFNLSRQSPAMLLGGIGRYFERIVGGITGAKVIVSTASVAATGTITFSALANNDTVTVNGRVYTAKTSGAAGLQQFNLGANDTAAAINFQAILNADTSSLVKGVVVASSSSAGVSLITSLVPGNIGNLCTLAISAHGSVSGANLTGGSEDAAVTISHGV